MLGAIFFKAQNKIQDPAKLARLVRMIDAENWISRMPTPRAICTKDCCKRTPRTPKAAARDKASLDVFWLKDDSLETLDDLPPPDVLQQEIIEHLEAALASFRDVATALSPRHRQ